MPTSSLIFDTHLAAFKEMQSQPWGKLRYSLALANLARYADGRAWRVLDAGGGNGLDTVLFAQQGHTVALADYSAEMLAEAKRHVETSGVAERVTFHQTDLAGIPALFPAPTFDLVLCHNVLQYVDDVTEALALLGRVLKPGGLISVICINRYSETYRKALMFQDPAAALAAIDAWQLTTATFGTVVHGYTAEEMRAPLQAAGCEVVGEYGIRSVCDYIPNNDIKSQPEFFAYLEKLEHTLTDKYPYYLLARFFQVVARKG